MLAISLLALIALGLVGAIVGISGLLRNRAKSINGLPSRKKVTGASIRKFVKERQWGIALLAIFGVSSIAIGVASNINPSSNNGKDKTMVTTGPTDMNLQASGTNGNLTRTGYAVTLSQYGAARLFDPTGLPTTRATGSVWGLSVNQMRFVYYGMDDQWHETSFQLNEMGWRWVASGSVSYNNAGTRPNTLLEEMQWANGFVSSQFYPDLPNYYYADAPAASHTTTTAGGFLPYEANANMMKNWPEFAQQQSYDTWPSNVPTNTSQVRGAVDHDDQLVFLAQNGQQVPANNWYRPDMWSRRVEIGIVDPVDNGHSWVYLYYNPATFATQPTPANSISADYCRTDSYIAPGESPSVSWNPVTDMIVATNYQMQMNPSNAQQFLNLKITVPGLLQTDVMQEFPKSFIWVDGRINFAGTTSIPPIHEGLAIKYGLSGTWFQTSPPSVAAMTGGAAPTDAPRSYDDVNTHVGVFYNHGNPDLTLHPDYGEPPNYQALGWEDNTGAKTPVWFAFGTTNPASTTMGALAVRDQWVTFAGVYEANTATDHAGYCFNDSAYWVYSSGALATASGTTSGTWNQVLAPFQDNLGLDGGAFNDKAATINGPVMAYIERISCMRVVIPLSWIYTLSATVYNLLATTNGGAGYGLSFELYTQQDLGVYPNAFYQYNISYPVPSLPSTVISVGAALDHFWAYFNTFQVTRGIETVAPGTCLYLGQGVANDTTTPALTQMSAAMNMLRANPATYAWIMAHGFPYYKNIQQLSTDNTAFVSVNYPMWSWATSVTNMPAGFFPKQLTFNNNSADDAANGYTATNTMGRAGYTTGTAPYHPWWDTSGTAPNQEQWIDNTVWRTTEIWNQNGGNTGATTHPTDAQGTPREMIPEVPRNVASTNVAPDWAILHVPNAGDVWVYMPVKETNEIKSKYSTTWQPNAATTDDSALVFKDNSTNVRTKIGDQEFGLFVQHIALGNSVIPYTIAMVFGNFNITSTASANMYGKREWVRNRLQLSLIFTLKAQGLPQYIVTSFGPTNHGLFYKLNDVVNLTVLTDYPGTGSGIAAATTAICTGLLGYTTAPQISNGGVGVLVGTINGTRNEYRYTIQFTLTAVPPAGDNVGPTLGTRHDFYYVSFIGGAYIANVTCGLFFDHTAPNAASFSLPALTTSPSVTIDWTTHPGTDNSDGTLVGQTGTTFNAIYNIQSGIASYTVLQNGLPVATLAGPGNGGTVFTYVDTNGGAGYSSGTNLQYSLQTTDLAGNVATFGPVSTTISLPITDPGRWDTTIPSASNVPFRLTWASHPGSGITSYNILRSLSEASGYVSISSGLGAALRSWLQPFGTTNASYINADDTYWYILQSVNGANVVNSTPVSVIRDTAAPSPASIVPLTSPYQPTVKEIPIDITGSGKSVDPGYYGPGNPNNMGSGVVSYSIYRAVNTGTGFGTGGTLRATVAASVIENAVWYDVDSGLTNGYQYRYWIISTDAAGNTANSTRIQFTFQGNVPANPVFDIYSTTTNVTTCQRGQWIGYLIKVSNIGTAAGTPTAATAKVTWSGVDETSQYTVTSNFTSASIGAGVIVWYQFNLRPNSGADLGVVLLNSTVTWSGGTTAAPTLLAVTIQAPSTTVPGAPTLNSATAGNGQVVLVWTAPASNGGSAITGYKVYQGTTSGGETLLATLGVVLTYTSTGLTNGQIYYFQVTAVNAVGESARSNELFSTPVSITVPGAPTLTTATAGNTQVVLVWTAPGSDGGSAITGYNVYRGTTSGGETLLASLGVVLTYTATGLTNGQAYYFQVTAVNAVGESATRSNELSATPCTIPGAPTLSSATAGNAQVVLVWTAPGSNGGSAITGYNVYRGTTSGGETLLANLGVVLTYTSAGLTNGQIYYFEVTAVNVAGESARSNELSATPFTVPGAPTLSSATPSSTQVVLVWTAPGSNGGSSITGYNVYRGTTSGGETLLVNLGVVLTYTNTGLTNGQIYYYQITAVNAAGESARSNELSATPATVPGAPALTTATPGNTQVVLVWTAPGSNGGSAITGYNVYRGTTSGGEALLANLGVVLTYTATGLTNGQIYYFQVTAVNAIGESARSNEMSATPVTVPGAPTLSSATAGNTQVVLVWTAPGSNGGSAITGYNVYRGTTTGGETLLANLAVVLTYTATGLTNGQIYYFEVTAVNAVGESARSNELSATPRTVPGAPTLNSATAGNTQVILVWSAPASNGGSAITGYNVYQGTTSGGETLLVSLGVVLTYTSTGLTNGQIYYYKVSAVNVAGESVLSNELSATPATTPGAPTGFTATPGNAQVVLNWVAPASNGGSAITGYRVYQGTASNGETVLANLGVVLTYTSTGLTNGQIYYFKVAAVNIMGAGTNATEVNTTPRTVPGAPTLNSATSGNTQVVIVWTAPGSNGGSAITGYNVYMGTTTGGETLLVSLGVVLTYTATGLTNGQIYYFQVSAVNVAGEGARSNELPALSRGPAFPPTLNTATAGNAQVVLTWTAPGNNGGSAITGYNVYRGTTSGSETLLISLGVVLTYTAAGLTNGQIYYFEVTAVNVAGEGARSNELSATPYTVPGAPTLNSATPTSTQVVLVWTAPGSNGGSVITGYNVYRGTTAGGETLLVSLGVVLTYTNTGLTNGQIYYYEITAVNAAGEGARSNEMSATPTGPPTAPQSLTATGGAASVVLNWLAPASNGGSAITGYNVYQGTTSGGETLLVSLGVVLTYTSSGLTNGVTYYFQVSAVNGAGEGPRSTEQSAIPGSVPSAPLAFTATPGNTQVVLNWNTPASNGGFAITAYLVYQGTTSGGETLLATLGVVLTYTSTGLTNGQIYYFQVAAQNSQGIGARASEISATPRTVPGAPTLSSATPGNAQVVLVWTAPGSNGGSAITGYNVYRGTSSGGETLLANLGVVLTYTSAGLTNGQAYYFEVTAVNVAGESVRSNELSATPRTVPGAPTLSTATAGNAQVVLVWTAPASNGGSAITGYNVYQGTSSGSETLLVSLGVVLTYTSAGLTNGQIYYFEVTAVNVAGEGARSNELSTTPYTVPGAPTLNSATAGNTQVVLVWTAPGNGGSAITGYNVYRSLTSGTETLLISLGVVLTYTNSGLTNGQIYYYKVSAVNIAGEGALSNELSATPTGPPTAPQSLTATAGNAQVLLNWLAPASNGGSAITGYNVYQGTTSGGETLLVNLGVVLTYTSTGLTNGQVYYFEVSAVNSVGEGPRSTEQNAIPGGLASAPLSFTATAGNTQIVLNWATPASNGGFAITGYNVYRSLTSGTETLLISLGVVLTYTNSGLTNGQIYFYKVCAVNSQGNGANATEVSATPATVPTAPQSLTATAGNTQVVLVWTAPASNGGSAITGYRIYQGTSSNGETVLANVGVVLTYTATGLTNGQIYYFKVAAVNVMGAGTNATEASATPAATPSAPQSFTATSGNAQVVLNWLAPASNGGSAITGYRIFMGTASNAETFLANVGIVLTSTATGLTNGLAYYFKVAAVNVMGAGVNATEASATPATVPGAPTGLTATAGIAQVVLNWVAPASSGGSPITNYNIYQGTSSGSETLLATVGLVLTYTSTGLTNGQVYYFQVAAVNGVGVGALATEASATPAGLPTAPQSFTATAGNTQVVLNWATPANNGGSAITNYHVYQGTSANGETLLTTVGVVLTYTSTGLTNGQIYYFKVQAVNSMGNGANSTEVNAMPATIATAPQFVNATARASQVTVNWTAPVSNGGSAISGYRIFYGVVSNAENVQVDVGIVLTYTVMGLTNGLTYYFKVAAINVMGPGINSTEVSGTPRTIPSQPQLFTASAGDTVVVLNWTAPASNGGSAITGYKVYQGTTMGGETLLVSLGVVLTYTSTGLTNTQTYYFEVTAVNSLGEGPRSAEASATPQSGITMPGAPTLSTATAGNTQVVLNWVAPASNGGSAITGYNVYRSLTTGTETLLINLGVVTTYTNTGLTNGQVYFYKVSAVNVAGEGALSNELSATPHTTVPGAPTGLTATAVSGTSIVLAWFAPVNNGGSAITGYHIYRGTSSGNEVLSATIPNQLNVTVTGLTSGPYYFQVTAVNVIGEGARSAEANAFVLTFRFNTWVSYALNNSITQNARYVSIGDSILINVTFPGLTQFITPSVALSGSGSKFIYGFVQPATPSGTYTLQITAPLPSLPFMEVGLYTDKTSGYLVNKTFELITFGPTITDVRIVFNGQPDIVITTGSIVKVDASAGWNLQVTLTDPTNYFSSPMATFTLVPIVDLLTALGLTMPTSTVTIASMGGSYTVYSMPLTLQNIGTFWQAGLAPTNITVGLAAVNSLGFKSSNAYNFTLQVVDKSTPTFGTSSMGNLTSQVLDPTQAYEVRIHMPVKAGDTSIRKVILFMAPEAPLASSGSGNAYAAWAALPGVQNVTFALVSGDEWMGMIQQQASGAKLYWAFYAVSYAGNEAMSAVGSSPLTYSTGPTTNLIGGYAFLGLLFFGIVFAVSYRVQQGVQSVKKAKKVTAPGKKMVAEKAAPGSGKKTPISKDIPTKECPICKAKIGADVDECPYCHKKFDSA